MRGVDAAAASVADSRAERIATIDPVTPIDRPPGSSVDQEPIDATLTSSLESLDKATNYRDWIVDLCAPHLRSPLLEVGAGHGTFGAHFASFGDVTAVEPDANAAAVLAQRYAGDERVAVVAGVVADVPVGSGFGSAVMINVLEHIADDHGVLRDTFDRLEPGGRLCIWVPSYELLFSRFDKKLGHLRRYRKRQLEADVRRAGFEVAEARHVNLPGWFSWLIFCRLLRREPTSPTIVSIFDKRIVPAVRWCESRVRVPFGQSVFLVARKPSGELAAVVDQR